MRNSGTVRPLNLAIQSVQCRCAYCLFKVGFRTQAKCSHMTCSLIELHEFSGACAVDQMFIAYVSILTGCPFKVKLMSMDKQMHASHVALHTLCALCKDMCLPLEAARDKYLLETPFATIGTHHRLVISVDICIVQANAARACADSWRMSDSFLA